MSLSLEARLLALELVENSANPSRVLDVATLLASLAHRLAEQEAEIGPEYLRTPANGKVDVAPAPQKTFWGQPASPQALVAQQEVQRVESELRQHEPQDIEAGRCTAAQELLAEANTIIVAKTIIVRLARAVQLAPRVVGEHAELALIEAVEALYPGGRPALASAAD